MRKPIVNLSWVDKRFVSYLCLSLAFSFLTYFFFSRNILSVLVKKLLVLLLNLLNHYNLHECGKILSMLYWMYIIHSLVHSLSLTLSLSRRLYVVFWSLSLYDLHVPKDRYNEEIGKAKEAIQTLENNQEMVHNLLSLYLLL